MSSRRGVTAHLPESVLARLVGALLALCLASPGRATAEVDVTTCGQSFAGAGRLVADLDCSGYADPPFGAAITIANRGTLDLNGHTLSGGFTAILCGSLCGDGVNYCRGNCTISGGTITGPASYGIVGRNITLHDLTVSDISWFAIVASRRLTIMDSTIGGSDYADTEGRWVTVYRSTISGDGLAGISSTVIGSIRLYESVVSGHTCDISSGRRPRLHNASCVTSCGDVENWGVCSAD